MLKVPDETGLLAFFKSEPVQAKPSDGFFHYAYSDSNNVKLDFSYNLFEKSIQTRLSVNNIEMAIVSKELAIDFKLKNDKSGEFISCTFDSEQSTTVANIYVRPNIYLNWFSLAK